MIYMLPCGITYTSIMCCAFHISIVAVPILFNDAIIVDLVTTGSAPVSVQTQVTFEAMFGCKLFVGYGSTENLACVSVSQAEDNRVGNVGPPNYGVMVRLQDWEEVCN